MRHTVKEAEGEKEHDAEDGGKAFNVLELEGYEEGRREHDGRDSESAQRNAVISTETPGKMRIYIPICVC